MENSEFLLVGFSGLAGAGKDTAASAFIKNYVLRDGRPVHRYSFAEPLKNGVATMLSAFGITRMNIEDRDLKERQIEGLTFSPRQMLQQVGTEAGRTLDPDLWVKIAEQVRSTAVGRNWAAMVLTDVRFENEAAWIRANGGKVIHIERDAVKPKLSLWRRLLVGIGLGRLVMHVTELGVKHQRGDIVIKNNTDIQDLDDWVEDLAEDLHDYGYLTTGLSPHATMYEVE